MNSLKISVIAAIAENNGIGLNNQLLWHLPDDLQFFKKTTLNSSIIMGRKTFQSIGKALPKRQNIVISSNPHF
ncbi:MAG: dihydrofolate reductase, partial [Bacteroidota bacterium]